MRLKLLPSISIASLLFLICISACEIDTFVQGKRLYTAYCETCHMADGSGLNKLIPTIDSDYYENNRSQLGCMIRYGMNDSIIVNGQIYKQEMPAFPNLSDFEIVNIINYMDNVLLKKDRFLSLAEARADLSKCEYKPQTNNSASGFYQ